MGRVSEAGLRGVLAVVLIVIACVLAPPAVAAVWTGSKVTDTGGYVDTVAPLASDDAVRNAVARRVSDEITGRVGLGPVVRVAAQEFVDSRAFATLWRDANRVAHAQLVALLSGERSTLIQGRGDSVVLDLGPVIQWVKQRLSAGIAARIPDAHPTFTLMRFAHLSRARRAYGLLDTLRWALPIACLACLVAGLLLARDRRRALVGVGFGLAAGMAVLWLVLVVSRSRYLDHLRSRGVDVSAAAAVFDALVGALRTGMWVLLGVGLVLAAGAWAVGRVRGVPTFRREFPA